MKKCIRVYGFNYHNLPPYAPIANLLTHHLKIIINI